MHVRKQYIVPLAALVISLGIISANLLAGEPLTVEEIIETSRERSSTIESYFVEVTEYKAPDKENEWSIESTKVDRSDGGTVIKPPGYRDSLYANGHMYAAANPESTIWFRWGFDESYSYLNMDHLKFRFPMSVYKSEITSSEDDLFVIDGYGEFENERDAEDPTINRMQLKIRKSDFVLVELTRWDLPVAELDNSGFLTTMRLPSMLAHLRVVYNFSQFGEVSLTVPDESDVLDGLFDFDPEDGTTSLGINSQITVSFNPSAELVEFRLEPEVPLDQEMWFEGFHVFTPLVEFEPATTYIATVEWKNDDSTDLQSHNWTFTTRQEY